MLQTRITLNMDSELIERLEAGGGQAAERIVEILMACTEFDLSGKPLFLTDPQHRRLRSVTGVSAVRDTEQILADLESIARLSLGDTTEVQIPIRFLERLASRAKVEGRTAATIAGEAALEGIRIRVGL